MFEEMQPHREVRMFLLLGRERGGNQRVVQAGTVQFLEGGFENGVSWRGLAPTVTGERIGRKSAKRLFVAGKHDGDVK